jgi:ribonuclease HI
VEQYRTSTATTTRPTDDEQCAKRQKISTATVHHNLSIAIHFDGGSRGNPGIGGAGAQVMLTEETTTRTSQSTDDNNVVVVKEILIHLSRFLGSQRITNNQAEYHGMLLALEEALVQVKAFAQQQQRSAPPATSSSSSSQGVTITIYGDSDLILQQMQGNYQVRSDKLVPLHRQANKVVAAIQKIVDKTQVRYEHVYRANNAVADGEIHVTMRVCVTSCFPLYDYHTILQLTKSIAYNPSSCQPSHGFPYILQRHCFHPMQQKW